MSETEKPKFEDFGRIKLNTVELEEGLHPNGNIEDFCDKKITGEELDSNPDFYSEENRKKAFGENYKSNNEIDITDDDGTIKKVNIPTIINGGMGTNVSSASLVEAMNKLGFGGHLSSIGIGFYHYYESHKDLFKENFNHGDGLKDVVQQDFDKLFKDELGLTDEFIEKHFFECDELGFEKNKKGEKIPNRLFDGSVGRERTARMMDLVATYRQTKDLKSRGNNVGINCMYKTTSYIASLKIAALCGIDYITTAAGNPSINPKEILKNFKNDLESVGKSCSIPAMGLLVSSGKAVKDFDYDYYIFEEGDLAGGHILRMGGKYEEIKKIKYKFLKEGKKMPPIYAAGGVSTNNEITKALEVGGTFTIEEVIKVLEVGGDYINEEIRKALLKGGIIQREEVMKILEEGGVSTNQEIIKALEVGGIFTIEEIIKILEEGGVSVNEKNEKALLKRGSIKREDIMKILDAGGISIDEETGKALSTGFDGVQIGTLTAVSEEACNGDGKEFKERLIGGNHLGENTEIDSKFFEGVEQAKQGFEKIVEDYNKQILSILDLPESEKENIEVNRVMDYLFKIIYDDFFSEKAIDLNDTEQGYYNKIKQFFKEKYAGSIEKINKVFRDLGNAKNFLKEFYKYIEENGKIPTTLVFDSTAGFPGRTKIIPKMYEVIAGNVTPTGCVGCLTDCICMGRGSVREDRGSTFCIYNRLNYLNPDNEIVNPDNDIAFTGRSTVPYDEIRPLKDIMAYLMGYNVEREQKNA